MLTRMERIKKRRHLAWERYSELAEHYAPVPSVIVVDIMSCAMDWLVIWDAAYHREIKDSQ